MTTSHHGWHMHGSSYVWGIFPGDGCQLCDQAEKLALGPPPVRRWTTLRKTPTPVAPTPTPKPQSTQLLLPGAKR